MNSHTCNWNLITTEEEVRRIFASQNPSKAAGPDNVSPRVLKLCSNQLAYIFSVLYNMCFSDRSIPAIWKKSCIIPVPKKPVISCMNDLRPIALTSVPMKVCERLVLNDLKVKVAPHLDPMQFAYQKNRNTEDAILTLLELLYSHLERTRFGNSARVMFFDFSSAFNTIQPHLLVKKLLDINVPCGLIQWTLDYLTNRSQYVKIGQSSTLNVISSSTGAPQGTVLAPFLFTLYTSDCRSQSSKCPLIKFADDTALIGLISKDDDRAFLSQVDSFVNHCDTNYLELNVSKTKEMVIDFRQARSDPQPVDIKGSAVARVETYKYLGIVLNNKLSWGDHVDLIVKKLNSRMYCLRKLNSFHITPEILNVFYTSTIVSVWRYCLVCWGGNVSKREKRRIDSIVRKAERVIGASQPSVDSVYLDLVGGKLEMVWSDTSHPLYGQLRSQLIPRGSGRLGLPYAGTNRHPASFIPKAIKMY